MDYYDELIRNNFFGYSQYNDFPCFEYQEISWWQDVATELRWQLFLLGNRFYRVLERLNLVSYDH